jgi:hypothetical protein
VGSASAVTYQYDKDGRTVLIKDAKLLLNNNNAGKPEGIHFEIGRRPHFAFGNSTGDRGCWNIRKPATARGSP